MESAEAPVRYKIETTATEVKEVFGREWLGGVGPDAVYREYSKGWYVFLKGSFEALHLGRDKPNIEVGDRIIIRIEKATDAKPLQPPQQ